MTLQLPNDHRRTIPRWRNSWVALSTGELVSSKPTKKIVISGVDNFQTKFQEWSENATIETASELVFAGLSLGRAKDVIDAAEFLREHSSNVMPAVLSITDTVIARSEGKSLEVSNTPIGFEAKELYTRIHNFRKALIDYPRNALMWVDLSRAYAVVGEWNKASNAMKRALTLAPSNRFVLRSSARLYVHLDEPDRAHFILANEPRTQNDPWLLAAEIAISNVVGTQSKFIRNSRNLLAERNHHPFHTAELASALATLDLVNGANRKARKLFEASLENPTENTVAQSIWAKKSLPTLEIGNAITKTPGTYEARALNAYLALDWKGVVAASIDWLLDEPFSSRPAVLGSYAAATGLEDYKLAESITRNGLIANPNDPTLINNHAFTLANQNKPIEALEVLKLASRPAPNKGTEIVLRATEGLIDLKLGNWEAGQAKYLDAISMAQKESLHTIAVLAAMHFVNELVNLGQISVGEGIDFVERVSPKTSDPDIVWLSQKLKSKQNKSI